MIASEVHTDDPEVLRRILTHTEALLLDFDGPVCSVFAGTPAHFIAMKLREVLADGGHTDLPVEVEKTEDPFAVFHYSSVLGLDTARRVEAALRAYEVEAVTTADPTSHSHELMSRWHATGRPLAIVSNNSASAVQMYLQRHGLASHVQYVSARTEPNPCLLKPSPHLIRSAASKLNARVDACTLLGDSPSDVVGARAAEAKVIGFANKPHKIEALREVRPDMIIQSLQQCIEGVINIIAATRRAGDNPDSS
ncbi:HAD family hydrolase [Saccharothrix xinjiangensis]|uniref:HAD family hydrolase n=1 Tax=Saccharothrix xinjiangensis TaxID=204798 RepID=A0ABV9Y330_9PSEU